MKNIYPIEHARLYYHEKYINIYHGLYILKHQGYQNFKLSKISEFYWIKNSKIKNYTYL